MLAIAMVLLTCFSLQALWLLWRSSAVIPARSALPDKSLAEVSVLIPCFNEEAVLAATVHSVLRSRGVRIARVICIDDGSSDRTSDMIRALQRDHGAIVQHLTQANAGKAAALNHGLRHVRSATFACIDADTQVLPDTLLTLAQEFAIPGTAAVAGHLVVGDAASASRLLHLGQLAEYAAANRIDRQALAPLHLTPVIPGPIGLFSSQVVRQLGGYDSRTLAEDKDLTMALLASGHEVRYAADAWALTEAPGTLRPLYRQRLRWATGKLQVLRNYRHLLRDNSRRRRTLWLYSAFNEILVPLSCLPLVVSLGILALQGTASESCTTLVFAYLGSSYLSHRNAWRLEARARLERGLEAPALRFSAVLVIHLLGFVAAWHSLLRGLGSRPLRWHKVPRRGDVAVPKSAKCLQHPEDISDTRQ